MATAAVQQQAEAAIRHRVAEGLQKGGKAGAIGMRQQQHEALARARLDRRIEPQPLVAVLMLPRWPAALGAPAPPVHDLETKAGLVHGKHPLQLVLGYVWPKLIF